MIPVSGISRPTTLDFHVKSKYLYFSDSQAFKIERVQMFQDKSIKEDFVTEGLNKVEGLGVDWVGENLYWSDEGLQAIYVASLDNPAFRKTLVQQNTSNVRSIAVAPSKGLLFWSNWNNLESGSSRSGSIHFCWLDGSNAEVLVESQLQWPNGLVYDSSLDTLFWSDTFLNKIESLSLGKAKGQGRKVIISGEKYSSRPYGLTVHKSQLFWTEFINGNIIKHDLEKNITSTLLKSNPQMFEIKFYSAAKQKYKDDACSELGCDQLCLLTPTKPSCACQDGFDLNSDQKTCTKGIMDKAAVSCKDGEFKCGNHENKCIGKEKVCDGIRDCSNGSDEKIGETCFKNQTCSAEEFACASKCISKTWLCDGDIDCPDKSDESVQLCSESECEISHQFKCVREGNCIPSDWECDGVPDCLDSSDEHQDCFNVTCLANQFTCDAHRCIPNDYKCDGEEDCTDGSDELDCPKYCAQNLFYCASDRRCIPENYSCNGLKDCSDGEDERDCPTQLQSRCEASEFSCGDGTCLPSEYVCDGNRDCVDGSDENHGNCTLRCTSKQRRCVSGHKCIPVSYWCDGDVDCDDGSDESSCKPVSHCPYPNFKCDTSLNKTKCINVDRLCNRIQDCKDGSDEGLICSENQCETKVNSCSDLCFNSPDGHRCSCPSGQHLEQTLKTCTELHPCSQWGSCSQLCKQVSRFRHKCFCNKGYVLQPDMFTCSSSDDTHPRIVFTDRHELKAIDLRLGTSKTLLSNLKNTIALDFYMKDGKTSIFWTDLADDCIYRGSLVGDMITDIERIVHSGLTTAEGLAVDWVGGNLYWIESSLDQIEVATLNGSHRRTLISGDMHSPRAMALDPSVATVFWTDWDTNGRSRIESCSMDGVVAQRKTVFMVSSYGGAWPNGITLDYMVRRIYWIDARSDSVHTTFYDGSDHREIVRGHKYLSHPFSLTLFGSHIYWTDWRTNSVIRANKWNGTNIRVMDKTLNKPYGIKVIHPSLQVRRYVHPCNINNGNCSHLCLLRTNQTAACVCPHVMRLSEDGFTCEESQVMLLYSTQNELRGVELGRPDYHLIPPVPYPNTVFPNYINFVAEEKRIYWLDIAGPSWPGVQIIRRARVEGEDSNVEVVVDLGGDSTKEKPNVELLGPGVGGLAVDWISKTLYFSAPNVDNSNYSNIFAGKLDGTMITIIKHLDTVVKDILVAPGSGVLYWHEVDVHEEQERILKSGMDGSQGSVIYSSPWQKEESPWFSCLCYSHAEDILFWRDNKKIKKYNLRTG